ncbi:General transcription and DNA repair factor IIH subunit TFB5 [Aphelenchoides bicaudatus]|nr:General transcription and DNA repair factor IIH subunit TFB5 [Aphelenchoides bicaudatus]
MVNVNKGTLITCDEAMLELLKHLDKTRRLGQKFIIRQLDNTHIIVEREFIPSIKSHVEQHLDNLEPQQ